nr:MULTISPECIES: type VI secretion protein [Pseudomonas syringae group]
MRARYWLPAVSVFVVLSFLAGCGGHFKFDDDEYRTLGDPDSINRGK